MATTWMKTIHAGKGVSIASVLESRTDYIKNPEKTDGGEFVDSYECDPFTAQNEFLLSKRQYTKKTGRDQGRRDVLAYHIRQSFKYDEVTPQDALRVGRDLALRFTKGRHQFIVAAHTNTKNPHVHTIFNAVNLECDGKFKDFKFSAIALRRLSDQICLENGLSIIENPGLSRGWNRAEYLGGSKAPSVRDKLRDLIDVHIAQRQDFNAFLAAMVAAGCEVKQGKHLAFKVPDGKKFIRCDSLGEDYTEGAILERLSGKRTVVPESRTVAPIVADNRPSLLIDIQAKIREGKGPAYEQWARIFNLKQAAKTLIFLKENGIDSYDDLIDKSAIASADFNKLSTKIKTVEKRLAEISELQKHIGTYSKTREIYAKYKASGWDKDFYEECRTDITLHRAAKKYFDGLGLKKLPSIPSLKQEYATLFAEKKKLYSGYRAAKENMQELIIAKGNADKILNVKSTSQNRDASCTHNRRKSYEI